jgi:hypothetical protein
MMTATNHTCPTQSLRSGPKSWNGSMTPTQSTPRTAARYWKMGGFYLGKEIRVEQGTRSLSLDATPSVHNVDHLVHRRHPVDS